VTDRQTMQTIAIAGPHIVVSQLITAFTDNQQHKLQTTKLQICSLFTLYNNRPVNVVGLLLSYDSRASRYVAHRRHSISSSVIIELLHQTRAN